MDQDDGFADISTPLTSEDVQRKVVGHLVGFLTLLAALTAGLALHGDYFGAQQKLLGAWNWFTGLLLVNHPEKLTPYVHGLLSAALVASTVSMASLALAAVPSRSRARALVLPASWLCALLMLVAAITALTQALSVDFSGARVIGVLLVVVSFYAWVFGVFFANPRSAFLNATGAHEVLAAVLLAISAIRTDAYAEPLSCEGVRCSAVAIAQGYWPWAVAWAVAAVVVRLNIADALTRLPYDHPSRSWAIRFEAAREVKPFSRY
ncbi:hypothetical protein D3C71_18980 [compost metagenome]